MAKTQITAKRMLLAGFAEFVFELKGAAVCIVL